VREKEVQSEIFTPKRKRKDRRDPKLLFKGVINGGESFKKV
jgi:hypothetical protein